MLDLIGHRPAGAVLVALAEGNRGLILRANSAFAGLVASTPDALAGTRLSDHFHPADGTRVLSAFVHLADGSRISWEGICCLMAADGTAPIVNAYASLVAAGVKQLVLMRFLERPT
jgi:hypothetical protein